MADIELGAGVPSKTLTVAITRVGGHVDPLLSVPLKASEVCF